MGGTTRKGEENDKNKPELRGRNGLIKAKKVHEMGVRGLAEKKMVCGGWGDRGQTL